MDIDTAIKHIIDGDGVIIFGSGGSWGAKNFNNEEFPTGNGLMKMLYGECCEDGIDGNLKDASDLYIKHFGMTKLITKLRNIFRVNCIKDYHEIIFSQPWIKYYTTNYDEVAIVAAGKHKKTITPATLDMDYRSLQKEPNICLFINGYIGNLNDQNFNSSFKLTTKSYYSTESIIRSQWYASLQSDLSYAKVIVILGLSLEEDLDLEKILRTNDKSSKTIIVESPSLSATRTRKLEKFGSLFKIGIESFGSKIKEISQTYVPAKKISEENYIFSCFTCSLGNQYSLEEPSNSSIISFYIYGCFDKNLLSEKNNTYDNILKRNELQTIVSAIKSNKSFVFLHAKLGNGKTIIIEQLEHALYREHIAVYRFKEYYPQAIHEDIQRICEHAGRKVVIIEDYYAYFQVISIFASQNISSITFVFTARTALYENKFLETCELFSASDADVLVINANKLEQAELNSLREMLSRNGLFRSANAESEDQKKYLLSNKNEFCERRAKNLTGSGKSE